MFEGAITAIVTPFKKDGSLDEAALRKLVDFQIAKGIDGIVAVGTTGESPTLSHEEHQKVVEIIIDQANGKTKVIAGTGSNSTEEALSLTRHAKDAGADAALLVCPYYNKPTQNGLYLHFKEVANKVDIPMILYNIQGRTGINMENATTVKLATECSNILAVKEASGNISQMMDLIAAAPKTLEVLSGDDNMTLPLMVLGGKGIISVASNIVPDKVGAMVHAALKKDWDTARQLHFELLPLFKAIFIETNPIPIKAALAMKGMIEESYRLPLCPMQPENKAKLKAILEKSGVL
jgi:4-hydroxy-tetrahydrodipicolinate synthase